MAGVRNLGDVRARRAERKREEILRAGLKVFAEKGFRAATMDDIALELEATKGLLYYHFKTKEEILRAILENNGLTEGLDVIFAALRGLELREALLELATRFITLMEANRELVRFLQVQSLLSGAEAEVVYTAVLERLYKHAAELFRAFQKQGAIRAEIDCTDLGRSIVDLLISHVLQAQIFGPRHAAGPGYLKQVVDVLLRGVSPAGRPARRR